MKKGLNYKDKIKKLFVNQKQRMRRLEKRGYDLSNYKLNKMPKTFSKKEYERLSKSLTLEKLYEKATKKLDNGKVVSGKVGREKERINAAKKAANTRKETAPKGSFEYIVISNFSNEIHDSRGSQYAINALLSMLNKMLSKYGVTGTAYILTERIAKAKYNINDALRPSASEEEVDANMVQIAEIMFPNIELVERRLLS